MFELYKNWMESFFFIVMLIGLLLALASPSAFISYIISFICGLMAGKLIYISRGGEDRDRQKIKLPFYMVIVGFFIGFLIGVYYGNRIVVVLSFIIASILSYRLHDKKILK